MNATIERDSFLAAIAGAGRFAGSKTIPILAHTLLRPEKQRLTLISTNLDLYFETWVAADFVGDDRTPLAIPTEEIVSVVKFFPEGAHLLFETNGAELSIRCGRSHYNFQALAATDFPDPFAVQHPVSFSLSGETLASALEINRFASKDMSRPYLGGVFFHVTANANPVFGADGSLQLISVSTEGHELGRHAVAAPAGSANMPPVIIPLAASADIARLAKESASEQIGVNISPSLAHFAFPTCTLTTKLVDGTFPDYQIIFPHDCTLTAIIDRIDLQNALRRIESASEIGSTLASLTAGQLTLSAKSNTANAVEELDIEWDGPNFDIGIKARGLLQILDLIDAEAVRFAFRDPGTAPIISAYRNGAACFDRIFLTMPMRY